MIDGQSVLAIIPARGGSKGLPRKNVLPLAGKPLIAWTIEAAKQSKFIDRLILSTDDQEIADVARKWSCEVPFMRPAELALDDTPTINVIRHALELFPDYEYVVVLQPTSPLRLAEDIDGCIAHMLQLGGKSAVTVSPTDQVPQWMFQLDDRFRMHPVVPNGNRVVRRQDAPQAYSLNGAVYVGTRDAYLGRDAFVDVDTIAYLMPRERSVDVDTLLDFKMCEWLIRNSNIQC